MRFQKTMRFPVKFALCSISQLLNNAKKSGDLAYDIVTVGFAFRDSGSKKKVF